MMSSVQDKMASIRIGDFVTYIDADGDQHVARVSGWTHVSRGRIGRFCIVNDDETIPVVNIISRNRRGDKVRF